MTSCLFVSDVMVMVTCVAPLLEKSCMHMALGALSSEKQVENIVELKYNVN